MYRKRHMWMQNLHYLPSSLPFLALSPYFLSIVPVILLMESPYCARGPLLLLMVLPLFTVICVTLLYCYLAHNKILIWGDNIIIAENLIHSMGIRSFAFLLFLRMIRSKSVLFTMLFSFLCP